MDFEEVVAETLTEQITLMESLREEIKNAAAVHTQEVVALQSKISFLEGSISNEKTKNDDILSAISALKLAHGQDGSSFLGVFDKPSDAPEGKIGDFFITKNGDFYQNVD